MIRLATLLILSGDFAGAYQVLDARRAGAAPQDVEFWRLFADLAWQMQQDDRYLLGCEYVDMSSFTLLSSVLA